MSFKVPARAPGRPKKPSDIEFKAGKATLKDRQVVSDSKKGFLKISITPDDLICVQWRNRDSATPVDEYFFVPGDLSFNKVSGCRTGRMYYLSFSGTNQKEFFWLQEPLVTEDAKIEEAIQLISSYIPDDFDTGDEMQTAPIPVATTPQTTTTAPAPVAAPKPAPVATTPTTNPAPPTNPTPSSATSGSGGKNILNDVEMFKNMLANMPISNENRLLLGKILTSENIKTFIMNNEDIKKELIQYLPEGSNDSHLLETIHSPQFSFAMDQLDYAISQGHGGEIVSQMGIEPTIASTRSAEGFLTSIQEGVNKKKSNNQTPKDDGSTISSNSIKLGSGYSVPSIGRNLLPISASKPSPAPKGGSR
eukprot:gene2535-3138_t